MDPSAFLAQTPAASHWKKVGIRHHHGINLPLFSLHSSTSCGIGDFLDLLPMIDWCASLGWDGIQLLPLNDSEEDPSPYNALSASALHPIYLNLHALPHLSPQARHALLPLTQLSSAQKVAYPAVRAAKEQFLKEHYTPQIHELKERSDFQAFSQTFTWLKDYALFKVLNRRRNGSSWTIWPERHRQPTSQTLHALYEEYAEEIHFHTAVQFLCFQQMSQVKAHATKQGVWLKGDIPILLSPQSADVWSQPTLFHHFATAGAPPDHYAKEGQNWGFPLYNWEALAQEQFLWWKRRLSFAQHFYHLYRLDHVVGFFRIWAIPQGKEAKEGAFHPLEEAQWLPQGETILRALLKGSSMLPIGEDLGVIPTPVRQSLKEMGICGTKVLRWERDWHGDQRFLSPYHFDPVSMSTVSTHDSETLRHWWQCHPPEARAFCEQRGFPHTPELTTATLVAILEESHQSNSLFHINLLQEYLSAIPGLHWKKPLQDRINTPGKLSSKNWCYRFSPSIEALSENKNLATLMRSLIAK